MRTIPIIGECFANDTLSNNFSLLHIGKFILFFKRLNVRYWHKADIQLTNNSFQCWWAGTPSLELTLFLINVAPTPLSFLHNFGEKNLNISFSNKSVSF